MRMRKGDDDRLSDADPKVRDQGADQTCIFNIEEYARHNGHADLIRELVDGSVGW
jgi:hypothetical protein